MIDVSEISKAEIDRDELTSVAADIVTTEAYLPRHRTALNELGLSVLSLKGCDRLVFNTDGDTVIKIPRTEERLSINYDEAAIWSQYGEYDIFAPVLETGPDNVWLEMAECDPVEDERNPLSTFCEKMDATPIEIIDTHVDNIGWFGDTLVAYDYPDIHVQAKESFY
jgi:hypothetical protein